MATKTRKKTSRALGLPQLRVHKQSGRVYATFNGRPVWFGSKDDPLTQKRFDAHLAQWLARGRKPDLPRATGVPVQSIVARFLEHQEGPG